MNNVIDSVNKSGFFINLVLHKNNNYIIIITIIK